MSLAGRPAVAAKKARRAEREDKKRRLDALVQIATTDGHRETIPDEKRCSCNEERAVTLHTLGETGLESRCFLCGKPIHRMRYSSPKARDAGHDAFQKARRLRAELDGKPLPEEEAA